MTERKKVLMVCLGNICRSPIAEAVFQDQINKLDLNNMWEVGSVGLINYHKNKFTDPRALSVLKENGIINYFHQTRVIKKQHFYMYDYIFGMDDDNIQQLHSMKPNDCKANITLLGKYDPNKEIIIKDPYYVAFYDANIDGFRKVYAQCVRSIKAFLELHKN